MLLPLTGVHLPYCHSRTSTMRSHPIYLPPSPFPNHDLLSSGQPWLGEDAEPQRCQEDAIPTCNASVLLKYNPHIPRRLPEYISPFSGLFLLAWENILVKSPILQRGDGPAPKSQAPPTPTLIHSSALCPLIFIDLRLKMVTHLLFWLCRGSNLSQLLALCRGHDTPEFAG